MELNDVIDILNKYIEKEEYAPLLQIIQLPKEIVSATSAPKSDTMALKLRVTKYTKLFRQGLNYG